MNTYFTWVLDGDGAATITARRPSEAAAQAAKLLPASKHPYFASIGVVRAETVNSWRAAVRKYEVAFSRSVAKVSSLPVGG